MRDARHQPIAVLELARGLPAKSWRHLSRREGTSEALSSRFARLRVRAAHRDRARAPQWLLIEWPAQAPEPTHYWLSTLPEQVSFKALVTHAKGRWRIERDYEELKSELGLSHYEGRNWRGFHHHATLCIAAYGFLMIERLGGKKTPCDSRCLTQGLPPARGSGRCSVTCRGRSPPRAFASHAQSPAHCPVARAAE